VVAEPSCLAAFRDELPALLADDPRAAVLASLARIVAEYLQASPGLEAILRNQQRPDRGDGLPARAVIHPHCHSRAIGGPRADRELVERLGIGAEILDAGCCGLAGSFGSRSQHEALSRQIGEEQWLPRVRSALGHPGGPSVGSGGTTTLLIDGLSCQMQLDQLSDLRSTALISIVRRALRC